MKKLFIVGIGPGGGEDLTGRAGTALEQSDIIIGYTVYVELLKSAYPEKEFRTTPMRKEVERCRMALDLADEGKCVAMVCSGDPGVYGMAGLCYELAEERPEVELEVIPGVTSANGGAAVLGAPLMLDFAVISLSDLLTPWELIEKRLRCAAQADFVICLYNPASKGRPDHLKKACDILLAEGIEKDRVCGIVQNIGREGEQKQIMTLAELRDFPADMFTTVYIGNSMTKKYGERMVTPRGYKGTI